MGILGTMTVNFNANANVQRLTKVDETSVWIEAIKVALGITNNIEKKRYRARRQSKKRMQVAQKRASMGRDILKRRSKRGNDWTYLQFVRHVELNHQWALPHENVCFRNVNRLVREVEEPNHWSIWRR